MITGLWLLGGTALEAVALRLFFTGGAAVEILAIHAAASVFFVLAGGRILASKRFFPGARLWLFCLTVSFPVFGALCSAALIGVMLLIPERDVREERVVVGMPSATAAFAPPSGGGRARSIMQILSSSDTLARRDAVLSLRSEVSPASVLILQRAVGDSDEQVRNYAQSELAKWTEQAELQIERFQEQAAKDPTPEVLMALAESCQEVVSNHLAGPEIQAKYLKLAWASLQQIPEGSRLKGPGDLLAMSCLLRLRMVREARQVFSRLESSGCVHVLMPAFRLRLLFHERRWDDLRAELKRTEVAELPAKTFWSAFA